MKYYSSEGAYSLPKYRRSHFRIFIPKFSRRICLAEAASSRHRLLLNHEVQKGGQGRAQPH